MCGIAGIYDFRGRPVRPDEITRMCDAIKHRGPDDEEYVLLSDGKKKPSFVEFDNRIQPSPSIDNLHYNIALGNRRLSIIDLVSGLQPISNSNNTLRITYNGELYNYRELKNDLEGKGSRFNSATDSEVVLRAYEEYGTDCLKYFTSMIAFAIWDDLRKELFLARDRIGIKPLYFIYNNNHFIFASEAKAILAVGLLDLQIDKVALSHFLLHGYNSSERTFFKGIRKLPPSCYLKVKNNTLEVIEYWDFNYDDVDYHKTEDEWIEEFHFLFKEIVKEHLISDVPLGVFLSGGVDSSTVVYAMSKLDEVDDIQTFNLSIPLDRLYDETEEAKRVASIYGANHKQLIAEPSDAKELLEDIIWYMEEPSFTATQNYLLSKLASQYVTVVLSGLGGDELFAGYERYKIAMASERVKSLGHDKFWVLVNVLLRNKSTVGTQNMTGKIIKFLKPISRPIEERYHFYFSTFNIGAVINLLSENEAKELPNPFQFSQQFMEKIPDRDALNKLLYFETKNKLCHDFLNSADKLSMAASLEMRLPFLDHRMVEFAARIPARLKLKRMVGKYILKKAMRDKLPNAILYKKKKGFSIPFARWLKEDLKDEVLDVLSEDNLKRMNLFNPDSVRFYLKHHLSGKMDYGHQIWALFTTAIWYRKFFENH